MEIFSIYEALPTAQVEKVVANGSEDVKIPHDSVINELKRIAKQMDADNENLAMAMAIYLLGFNTYTGFSEAAAMVVSADDNTLRRLYEYAKRITDSDNK